YFDHRLTNAVLEGMNSIIQSAKRQARGFSNLEYFKTIIYLNLGKLHFPQLAPCATH
ncbi:transposase, partial [Adlercreutzia sp. ZJ138]|uniref:transposase n=1 Tax=Adlercreutzia sp. ZJ138 TaxID=2709405 RepID=UPI0013E9B43B